MNEHANAFKLVSCSEYCGAQVISFARHYAAPVPAGCLLFISYVDDVCSIRRGVPSSSLSARCCFLYISSHLLILCLWPWLTAPRWTQEKDQDARRQLGDRSPRQWHTCQWSPETLNRLGSSSFYKDTNIFSHQIHPRLPPTPPLTSWPPRSPASTQTEGPASSKGK